MASKYLDIKHDKILSFMTKYDKLAPIGPTKNANLKRFCEMGFSLKKFKIHLSLDKRYFLTEIANDVEYYKAFLRLVPTASLDFYQMGYFGEENDYGYHKIKVPDSIITNFYQAKIELREECVID